MCYAFRLMAALLLGLAILPSSARADNPYRIYRTTVYPSAYWGYAYNPYTGLGNYYTGIGNLVRAQGQFLIDEQEALNKQQERINARIDTRRKKIEQWLWERQNMPTPEEERERVKRQELRRSLDPPVTEIWSAKALNDLLGELRKLASPAAEAEAPAIDAELLRSINVTSGKNGGNIGLLKDGKIDFWPMLLRRAEFDTEREKINQLTAKVCQEASRGQAQAETVEGLIQSRQHLEDSLRSKAKKLGDKANGVWTYQQYSDAMKFLEQLDAALSVLQDPNAAQFLSGALRPQGRTVAELIKFMKEKGIEFAPATAKEYMSYRALHTKMADYARIAGIGPRVIERAVEK